MIGEFQAEIDQHLNESNSHLEETKNVIERAIQQFASKEALIDSEITAHSNILGELTKFAQSDVFNVDDIDNLIVNGGVSPYGGRGYLHINAFRLSVKLCWICSGLFRKASEAAYRVIDSKYDDD